MHHHDDEERQRFRRTVLYNVFVASDQFMREIDAAPQTSRGRGISDPSGSAEGPAAGHHFMTQAEMFSQLPTIARAEVNGEHPHLAVVASTHICDVCDPDGIASCPHIGQIPVRSHLLWVDVNKLLALSAPAPPEVPPPPAA
ncbi:MAG: hypothetical protein WC497_01815 [Patescibacteria group bacterium]